MPDFKNLYYLSHLNESEDDASENKDLTNDTSEKVSDVNTNFLVDKIYVEINVAK